MSWRKYLLIPRLTLASMGAPRSQTRAWEKYWDGVSRLGPDGDVLWDADEPAEAEMLAAMLGRHADPALPMVDLGCGSGRQAHALAAFAPRVIGIDGSAAAVARASRLPDSRTRADAVAAPPDATAAWNDAGASWPDAAAARKDAGASSPDATAASPPDATAASSPDATAASPPDATAADAGGAGGVVADAAGAGEAVANVQAGAAVANAEAGAVANAEAGGALANAGAGGAVANGGAGGAVDGGAGGGVVFRVADIASVGLGERGTLYLCETNHTGDPLDYLLDQGARPTRLPPLVHRLIRAGVRAPRRFGADEMAQVFPADAWEVAEQGATEVYGIPLEPGGPVQRIPAWYAVVRTSRRRRRR